MADTKSETKTSREELPAEEVDSEGWTAQMENGPPVDERELPMMFSPEQLPDDEACEQYGLTIPERQITEDVEMLDPADRVRIGEQPSNSTPFGITAYPEGTHIPGESDDGGRVVAAPEAGVDEEGKLRSVSTVGADEGGGGQEEQPAEEGEEDLNSMTKAELEALAEERGVYVTSSMTKAEMVEAIEAGPTEE